VGMPMVWVLIMCYLPTCRAAISGRRWWAPSVPLTLDDHLLAGLTKRAQRPFSLSG